MKLSVLSEAGSLIHEEKGDDEICLLLEHEYTKGDRIVFEPGDEGYYWIQLDEALGKALVYVRGNFEYPVPFGEKRVSYSPKTFMGGRHYMNIRKARDFEAENYRNLSLNPYDHHGNDSIYPHAHANVETRGEAVFAARNAIDGITENRSHGEWPYASWGINMQDDAAITIDFGREVETDRIILYTRADFPHDNWWTAADFVFSDGTEITMKMEKSYDSHELILNSKKISWVRMQNLIKADDPSPFPALTQIEIYGR